MIRKCPTYVGRASRKIMTTNTTMDTTAFDTWHEETTREQNKYGVRGKPKLSLRAFVNNWLPTEIQWKIFAYALSCPHDIDEIKNGGRVYINYQKCYDNKNQNTKKRMMKFLYDKSYDKSSAHINAFNLNAFNGRHLGRWALWRYDTFCYMDLRRKSIVYKLHELCANWDTFRQKEIKTMLKNNKIKGRSKIFKDKILVIKALMNI